MTSLTRTIATTPVAESGPLTCLQGWPVLVGQSEATDGDARLTSYWYTSVEYEYPSTWTIEEAREAGSRFAAEVERYRCVGALLSLPYAMVEIVCPQVEEIIEHETKMLKVRAHPAVSAIRVAPTAVKRLA